MNVFFTGVIGIQCSDFYIDLGTNVGWQIEKLYNPLCKAPVSQVFNKVFGHKRNHVCTIGFEPNPTHTHTLEQLEQKHAAHGRFVDIHMGFAGTRDGMRTLYFNNGYLNGESNNQWSASGVSHDPTQRHVSTKEFNISRILLSLPTDANIVMKIDIEGDESTVVPALIHTRALCRARAVYYEFHNGFKLPPIPCPNTKMIEMDDEASCQ